MAQDYKVPYNTYPIFSEDLGFEGATKRFRTMPTPQDVYDFALLGLPKFFPLTGEAITPAMCNTYLENAISEIEMSLNIDITPVQHSQSFDYIDGMFSSNYTGLKLERWPATQITSLQFKFPHTQTATPYQAYTLPAFWIALRRNRINVVAAFGSVQIQVNTAEAVAAGGLFGYITGFARGAYQPGILECKYVAGFELDKLPNTVHDLIVTLASLRFLENFAAALFPFAGTSVQIDAVSQSAQIPTGLLAQKIQSLKDQYQTKVNAITRHFGRTIKMAFIGA